jgi:hypothetical protein
MPAHNKRIHSDKIKLRRFAPHLYFTGDARRWERALYDRSGSQAADRG